MRTQILIAGALALLIGCGRAEEARPTASVASPSPPSAAGQPQPAPATAAPTGAALRVAATILPEAPSMPSPPPSDPSAQPDDPALAPFVDQARADLAQRRAADPAAIALVEARSVIWPNPGLGCPQPGMAYKQVPVDGLLIRLSLGGQIFSYHSGSGKPPFLCEQPAADPAASPAAPPRMDQ